MFVHAKVFAVHFASSLRASCDLNASTFLCVCVCVHTYTLTHTHYTCIHTHIYIYIPGKIVCVYIFLSM